ncbi:MAG TPA: hypothetical protein VMQ51_12825 [Candidatus Binatia bacterium]|nr:hypothetical protein [Candidatus Binatia bacterium]
MNPDFRDLLRALSDAGARFLVVGAYAVSFHAEPRATGDLDIWIDRSSDNAGRVYRALVTFGAPLTELTERDLTAADTVFQIGVAPRRIDIMTSITGVEFPEAWERRSLGTYDDVAFPLIGIGALVKNKLALGRPKDVLDVELLRRHHPSTE